MKKRVKKTIKVTYYIDREIGLTGIRAFTDEPAPLRNLVLDEIIKHPRRVQHTAKHRRRKKIVNFCRRAVYALTHIKIAMSREFSKEDFPRHQYDEPTEIPARIGY